MVGRWSKSGKSRGRRHGVVRTGLVLALLAAGAACTDSGDKGGTAAPTSETKSLEDALKAHRDRFGAYAGERELVAAGLLTQESALYEVSVSLDGKAYKIGPEPRPVEQQTLTVGFQADPWTYLDTGGRRGELR